MAGHSDSPGLGIDLRNLAPDEANFFVEKFFAVGRDVPGFYFPAQILVEHRLEQKMVFIIDQGNFSGTGEVEGREQPAKPAADD